MSVDRAICEIIRRRWSELFPSRRAPGDLLFMKVQGKVANNASVIAIIYDSAIREPVAVAKIPRNPECTVGIDREYAAMQQLGSSLSRWAGSERIPYQGFIEAVSGVPVLVQRAANGYSLVRDMVSREDEERIYADVLPWLIDFHRQTAKSVVLVDTQLDEFVCKPVQRFIDGLASYPDIQVPPSLGRYLEELPSLVKGAKLNLCAQHGDFNAHNIIVNDKGASPLDFAVIDWEDYREAWLPVMDVNHFFISNSKLLDMSITAEQAFARFIIGRGWYQDLYIEAVKKYQAAEIIDSDIYWKLTPLYMTEICVSLMESHRQQHKTLEVWINRAATYIDKFPLLTT